MFTYATLPFVKYAGVGVRGVAVFLDTIFATLVFGLPIAFATDQTWGGDGGVGFTLNGKTIWLWLFLALVYAIVMEAIVGATVGKLLIGLRVKQRDGTPISWRAAVIRNVLRVVDAFPYFIPYLAAAFTVWNDPPERQRLGDRPAHTVVVFKD